MAEGIEPLFCMVAAHTAGPDSSKGEVGVGEMHDRIIDASSSIADGSHHDFLVFLVVAEQIQCKGVLSCLDIPDSLFKGLIGKDGQNRAEDLVTHERSGSLYIGYQSWCNFQVLWVDLPTVDERSFLKKTDESVEVSFVDDVGKVIAMQWIAPKHVGDSQFHLFYQLGSH